MLTTTAVNSQTPLTDPSAGVLLGETWLLCQQISKQASQKLSCYTSGTPAAVYIHHLSTRFCSGPGSCTCGS